MNTKSLKFGKSQVLSFILGMSGVFIMFLFQALDIHPVRIISPLVSQEKKVDIKEEVSSKLNKTKNNFNVKKAHSIIPLTYAAQDYDNAAAYAAVDLNTGEVLVEKNLSEPLPVASITKVMSAVVALDLVDQDELITVTKKAADAIPTKIGVVAGQKMTVKELITAMLLVSANDATQALADGVDKIYGKGTFVSAMNEKAQVLELKNSYFTNPQGFDYQGNHSSVEDLAILAHYALNNYPLISDVAQKDYEFLPEDSNHKQFDLYNWNGLLDVYPGAIGLKIGNTGKAGYTTTVVSEREGKKILAVVLGAPGILERDMWAASVLDAGFEKNASIKPVKVTEEMLLAKYKTWKYWN